ncbi:MAG: hypothetical protein JWM86_1299 [Thermoleophilia bacterium]|nr:hypothetical protein [Thermoleophilia bacterium]
MQLASHASARLIPSPRPSADHASFDVLALRGADGSDVRVGLVPRSRFYMQRGSSYDDAVAGARELAVRDGGAWAVVATHPGQLFVVPAFLRGAAASNTRVGADLALLASATPVGRHAKALAIVGAAQVLDLRPLPATLGSGRG